jgi:hypothetical protein
MYHSVRPNLMGNNMTTLKSFLAICLWTGLPFLSVSAPLLVRPHLAVEPADLHGVVLFSDGETPVTRLGVRIWDSENERSVYRTQTNEEGIFSVPSLGNGRYFLVVGDLSIDLEVFSDKTKDGPQQSHDIVVVIPRRFLIGTPGYQSMPLFLGPLIKPGESTIRTIPPTPPSTPPPTVLTPLPLPPPERTTSP